MNFSNAYVTFDAENLSDHIRSVDFVESSDINETTTMSSTGHKTREGGLTDWSFSCEMKQSFVASKTYHTLRSKVGSDVVIIFSPSGGTPATTNPQYTMTGILESYPIGGSVGDHMIVNLTFQANSTLSVDDGS